MEIKEIKGKFLIGVTFGDEGCHREVWVSGYLMPMKLVIVKNAFQDSYADKGRQIVWHRYNLFCQFNKFFLCQ